MAQRRGHSYGYWFAKWAGAFLVTLAICLGYVAWKNSIAYAYSVPNVLLFGKLTVGLLVFGAFCAWAEWLRAQNKPLGSGRLGFGDE